MSRLVGRAACTGNHPNKNGIWKSGEDTKVKSLRRVRKDTTTVSACRPQSTAQSISVQRDDINCAPPQLLPRGMQLREGAEISNIQELMSSTCVRRPGARTHARAGVVLCNRMSPNTRFGSSTFSIAVENCFYILCVCACVLVRVCVCNNFKYQIEQPAANNKNEPATKK